MCSCSSQSADYWVKPKAQVPTTSWKSQNHRAIEAGKALWDLQTQPPTLSPGATAISEHLIILDIFDNAQHNTFGKACTPSGSGRITTALLFLIILHFFFIVCHLLCQADHWDEFFFVFSSLFMSQISLLSHNTRGWGKGINFKKLSRERSLIFLFLFSQLAAAVSATHRRARSSKQTGIQLKPNPAQRISLIDSISLKGGFDRKIVFWWKQIPCKGSKFKGILWNIVFIHEEILGFGCWKWNLEWNYSFKLFPVWKKN